MNILFDAAIKPQKKNTSTKVASAPVLVFITGWDAEIVVVAI
jgi:hypothetical protein